jgi:hypothetical protein
MLFVVAFCCYRAFESLLTSIQIGYKRATMVPLLLLPLLTPISTAAPLLP